MGAQLRAVLAGEEMPEPPALVRQVTEAQAPTEAGLAKLRGEVDARSCLVQAGVTTLTTDVGMVPDTEAWVDGALRMKAGHDRRMRALDGKVDAIDTSLACGAVGTCRAARRWETGEVALIIDRPLDLEDLVDTPEDGNRSEILDWAFVVSPRPRRATSGPPVSCSCSCGLAPAPSASRPSSPRWHGAPGPGRFPSPT